MKCLVNLALFLKTYPEDLVSFCLLCFELDHSKMRHAVTIGTDYDVDKVQLDSTSIVTRVYHKSNAQRH